VESGRHRSWCSTAIVVRSTDTPRGSALIRREPSILTAAGGGVTIDSTARRPIWGDQAQKWSPPTKRARVDGGMKAPSPDPHLARTPGQLEKFPESFIEEMDDVLIQPEWFNAWEGYFKEELSVGTEYEPLDSDDHGGIKGSGSSPADRPVAVCSGERVQASAVKANEGLAGVREGLPRFNRKADPVGRVRPVYPPREGGSDFLGFSWIFLVLWAGHDYSSAKGQDIAHWAKEYRRLILRKGTTADVPTYHQWSNMIRGGLAGTVRTQGASADSGLFDQMHGEGKVSLCSTAAHCQNPAERGRGQVEAVH
jgi:hypothetical protein